jgi:mono/diheme cytochrome c family protein
MKGVYALLAALPLAWAVGLNAAEPPAGGEDKPYTVVDGNKVDPLTLKGFRAWRAAACERCHGATQAGLVGPSLIESLKRLSKEEFKQVVLEGRLEKGMPAHKNMKTVVEGIDGLYAYLKGRSDGAIKPGRLEAIGGTAGSSEGK